MTFEPFARPRTGVWPRSLQGQMVLAIALALLVTQSLSAFLIWRAQHERMIGGLVNSAAVRLLGDRAWQGPHGPYGGPRFEGPAPEDRLRLPHALHVRIDPVSPEQPGDVHMGEVESGLHDVLEAQGVQPGALLVLARDPRHDRVVGDWLNQVHLHPPSDGHAPRLVLAAMRQADGTWLTVRMLVPSTERQVLLSIVLQTILLYIVLVGAVALILRRIARPLRALTHRVELFARERSAEGQLVPEGPADIRHLIIAHNAMEARIAGLLDEKDVMLGAIGHDLKTPLAALRVRIEAVEDDTERGRMAATIEDINNSLDDILSLARVGRPSDPIEPTELSALVADVVGEYEDMGEPVEIVEATRMVVQLRATWLRRGMRNLVSNALRYGCVARVRLERQGHEALLSVEDDGPGIAESDISRMLEPFTRLESSRNLTTGGAGLGLTLARAIAEQHGGALTLVNRVEQGEVKGLVATLRLPIG